jgi:zinc protease
MGYSQGKAKATDLNEKIKLNGTVRYGKLENGLTYYIKANKKPEARAEFFLAVNAGSVLEEVNELGLAHFTEHMNFNGTRQFPGGSLIDQLEKKGIVFGADINAYTSFDETVYNLQLPTDDSTMLDMGLKILDGWAGGALMTGTEIDKERGVVTEEWRTRQGGNLRIQEKIWSIMLKGSRYAERMPIGTYDWLQNFKYQDIRGFYKKWYRPDNMAVIIVGDFDADVMEQKVKDFFTMNDKPVTPTQRPTYSIPANKEPIIGIASDKEASSNSIQIIYKQPVKEVKTVGDFREKHIVYELFEQMIQSRFQELGEKKSCPYMNAFGGYGNFLARDIDAYYTGGSSKEGKTLQSMEVILTENYRVMQHGFLPIELEQAKDALLTRYDQAAKEESKTENTRLARELVADFLGEEPYAGARIENKWAKELMDGVTLEEVNALAKKWLTDENMVVTVTMPEKKGIKIPTEQEVLKVIAKVKNAKTTPWVDNTKTEPFFAQNVKAGKVTSTKKNEKFGFTEYTLSNGATVIIMPTIYKNDEIYLSAQSAGGSSLYPDNEMINAQFAANIIDECGIGTYNHTQLMKFLKGKVIGLNPSISEEQEKITGSCSPQDLEYQLQYLNMYFTAPRADKEVLDNNIEKLKTQISQVKNMPEFAFQEEWLKSMYPTSKRNIILPTEAQLKQMDINKMLKIWKERFSNAADFTFTFVGNIDEATALPLIEKYIGSLPSSDKREQFKDVSTPFAKGVVEKVVYAGTADKSMLTLTMEKPFTWSDKERMATNLLNNIIDIKLTQTIREEMGGTYSPYFKLDYDKYPQPKVTAMAYYMCSPDNVDKIADATFGVFDKIIADGPTDEDLAKAKEQLISERKVSLESNRTWASIINGSRWFGYEMTTLEQYTAAINAMTKEDIKAVAVKYLNHNEYLKVSMKPESMKPAK